MHRVYSEAKYQYWRMAATFVSIPSQAPVLYCLTVCPTSVSCSRRGDEADFPPPRCWAVLFIVSWLLKGNRTSVADCKCCPNWNKMRKHQNLYIGWFDHFGFFVVFTACLNFADFVLSCSIGTGMWFRLFCLLAHFTAFYRITLLFRAAWHLVAFPCLRYMAVLQLSFCWYLTARALLSTFYGFALLHNVTFCHIGFLNSIMELGQILACCESPILPSSFFFVAPFLRFPLLWWKMGGWN